MKNLPPVERRADGSLYRMDGKQRREGARLIKGLCSYYDNGNCLYLDRGEAVTCPQSISYSVCCKFFRHVLLKDQEGKGLEAEVFQREALKRCARPFFVYGVCFFFRGPLGLEVGCFFTPLRKWVVS